MVGVQSLTMLTIKWLMLLLQKYSERVIEDKMENEKKKWNGKEKRPKLRALFCFFSGFKVILVLSCVGSTKYPSEWQITLLYYLVWAWGSEQGPFMRRTKTILCTSKNSY